METLIAVSLSLIIIFIIVIWMHSEYENKKKIGCLYKENENLKILIGTLEFEHSGLRQENLRLKEVEERIDIIVERKFLNKCIKEQNNIKKNK